MTAYLDAAIAEALRGQEARAEAVVGRPREHRRVHSLEEPGAPVNFCQFLAGSFSDVSKRNFATKYAFDNIFMHFSSSTRFASFCTAAISIFSQKIGLKNCEFHKISENFGKFWKIEFYY